jgi:transposase
MGFDKLLKRAEESRQRHRCASIVFALEATGHYGHALRYFLADRGYELVGINPAHTKRIKELEDNSPEKSDAKDAGLIADLASEGRGRPGMLPRGVFADLRRLGKYRERLVSQRTRLLNRYHGMVDLLFPELSGIVRDVACRSMLRLFSECPSAIDIAKLDRAEMESRLWRWSRGQLGRTRISEIYRAAGRSVGIRDGLDSARLELSHLLCNLTHVESELAEVEAVQVSTVTRVPYARLLLSVPDLGAVTVATILGETGDLREYPNASAVIKMAGYNLYRISSGSFTGKTRISKRGRPLLRHYLFLAALRMSKRGGLLRGFRNRLKPRLAGPQIAVGGCRKLLRLLFALVRDNKFYEPGRLGVEQLQQSVA